MKLGPRELIVFAVLLAFLGGAWFLGFRRIAAERATYIADAERKRNTLATLQQHAASVDELDAQIASVHEAVDLFEKRLPRQKEVDVILGDVWQLCERNDLHKPAVHPLKAEQAGACSELPIELSFEGEFPGVLAFLRDLEASDRIVRVTQLDCISDPLKPHAPLAVKLTLNIYFEPESAGTLATASAR